jgi:mRNA interferase RelE/StbE
MSYRVEFKAAARREIKKLSSQAQKIIIAKAESLAQNPLPSGVKKLEDSPLGTDLFRVKAGDYRIVYQIQQNILVVLIVKIGNRRDVYK